MSKQWQFISTSESGKPEDEETRRVVRGNAMRAFRRNERLARMREHTLRNQELSAGLAQDSPSNAGQGQPTPEREDESQTQHEAPTGTTHSMPIINLRAPRPGSAFDPFSSTALPRDPTTPRLLEHFINNIAPQLQPLGTPQTRNTLNTFLAQTAQEDPGAIASILFHASLHSDSQQGRQGHWSPATLHYYGKTIRILNERLDAQEQEHVASDSSLCMVGFLAGSGNITGDVAADQTYWNALQTLLDMRGGMSSLGWKGALGLILQIGDLIHTTISASVPRLKAPDVASNPLVELMPRAILAEPSAITDIDGFEFEITMLIDLLQHLTTLQQTIFANPGITIDTVLAFTQLCIAVEHRVLSLGTATQYLPADPQILLFRAAHLTLTILMFFIFRNFTARSATFKALEARLIPILTALETASSTAQTGLERQESEMLLWILWIGAMASLDQQSYMPRLLNVLQALGLNAWCEIKQILQKHVWSPRLETQTCWDLCDTLCIEQPARLQEIG